MIAAALAAAAGGNLMDRRVFAGLRSFLRAWPVVASMVVAACGGGGGGAALETASLVPPAPTPGAVLVQDAATLRPLRDGASYVYRGAIRAYGPDTAQPQHYARTTTQQLSPDGMLETSISDDASVPPLEGVSVSVRDGVVMRRSMVEVTAGLEQTLEMIELRSPVRAGDQYTIFEQHLPDSGADFDGDGTHDAVDMAIYAQVVGTQSVDLLNLRAANAVVVDVFVKLRAKFSATGSSSEVITIGERRWYVAGIGIVKVLVTNSFDPSTMEEQLVTWDGVTGGLGDTGLQPVFAPTGPLANTRLARPEGAVAFDTHAVVLTNMPNLDYATFALTRLDLRGRPLATARFTGLYPLETPLRLLARAGDTVCVIGFQWPAGIVMVPFDATGQVQASAPVTLSTDKAYVHDPWPVRVANEGDRFWLLWGAIVDADNSIGDLKVQAFAASGAPASPPITVAGGVPLGNLRDLGLAVGAQRLVASWKDTFTGATTRRYAVIDTSAPASTVVHTLPPLSTEDAVVTPVAPAEGAGLLWGDWTLHLAGVTLDAQAQPMPAPGMTTAGSGIAPAWLLPPGRPTVAAVQLGHAVITATASTRRLWPEEQYESVPYAFFEWMPGPGPWNASSGRLLAQMPSGFGMFMLPYDDRVLLVANDNHALSTSVVWRRP
jgi:hypothetical protein